MSKSRAFPTRASADVRAGNSKLPVLCRNPRSREDLLPPICRWLSARWPFLGSIWAQGIAVLLVVAGSRLPLRGDSPIDSFDSRSSVAPWVFSNGPEFPGATGSLALGQGRSGGGARLAYDFSQGGSYVAMTMQLPTPLSTPAIGFWVRSPSRIAVALRISDASGQTLLYRLGRPITAAQNANAWYRHVVALDGPTLWYGGPNDGVVHYPVRSIGCMADNRLVETGGVGAIDFDDFAGVESTDLYLDPAQSFIPADGGGGDMLSRLGVQYHWWNGDDNRVLDAARTAGFSWIRTDLMWASIETRVNVYNWTFFDSLIAALRERGLKAFFILAYGNALHTGGTSAPTTAAAIKAYGNFVEAAARHFAGTGARFEVWNEANHPDYWKPTPDPNLYVPLALEAIQRLRVGDPNALVSTTGLSGFDLKFAAGFLSKGVGVGYDAIGVHPYDVKSPVGTLAEKMLSFRTLIGTYLSNTPAVWNTEWGFSAAQIEVDPKNWTTRIVNPNSGERSACQRRDVSTVWS